MEEFNLGSKPEVKMLDDESSPDSAYFMNMVLYPGVFTDKKRKGPYCRCSNDP
jgi:hypothetical protein